MALLWVLAQEVVWVRLHDRSVLSGSWDPRGATVEVAGRTTSLDTLRIERVVPGIWYDEAFLRTLDGAIRNLGDEDSGVRDRATGELVAMGTVAADRLRTATRSRDPEVVARSKWILERIAQGEGGRLPAARPDRLETGAGPLEGRLGKVGCRLTWKGAELSIPWERIAGLDRKAPPAGMPEAARPAAFERLRRGPAGFGDRVITFDTDAQGRPIAQGTDVETAWREWGVILDSEIATSVIFADSYVVEGVSRGNSGSTKQPLWTGHVNLCFFLPGSVLSEGRQGVPAGVHHVGVYVAAVSPRGTGLRGYGLDGRILHEVLTENSGTDFIGMRSPVPIHRVEVFDDPKIDNNFTTDDFVFGPITTSDGDPDHFVVVFKNGERVTTRSVRGEGADLVLSPVCGEGKVKVKVAELAVVCPPLKRIRFEPEPATELAGGIDRWDDTGVRVGDEAIPWDQILRVRVP